MDEKNRPGTPPKANGPSKNQQGKPPIQQQRVQPSQQQAGQASRPQSIRRANPLPPDQSVIANDFHKRLRGKPTHAAHSHTWYGGIGGGVFFFVKIFLVLFLLVVFVLGGFGGGMLVGYISTTKPITVADLMINDKKQTTFVYDKNGTEIQKLTGSDNVDRVFVSYSEIKGTYIDEAITSIEDERFYEHNGIDIQRIGSAILSALSNGGTATHGGSTITQQTIKMISGQNQVSTQRKVQEWFSAMDLEQKLTKDEIMELYVNQAPMGNNFIGVQSAAQNYFGKNAKDLSLTECAFLAGIPKSPSYYNPLRESGKRNALRRMRVVLSKMHELGKITDIQYEEALNSELVFKTAKAVTSNSVQSFFVEYAVSEVVTDLMAQRNISKEMAKTLVYNNGYKIYTTLEPTVQASLDTTFMTQELFQKDPAAIENLPEKPQSGMVIINVETGAIAAMQGGYGEKEANLIYNRATTAYRQPGSSIKPLIDYGPALERKLIVPTTIFMDAGMNLDPANPTTIWPKNAGSFSGGPLTVRQAIYKSSNVIAVQVWDKVGGDMALWFLQQVGIDRTKEVYPATAIGGFNEGMTPLEMAAGYATLANKGKFREPYAYTKVEDPDGTVIMKKDILTTVVYSPETAFILSNILEDVILKGTASGKVQQITTDSGEAIEVAGKTGSSDDYVDKWFCGYTPYYAAATWYGYDNKLIKTKVPKIDQNNAMLIWNDAMQKIHKPLTPSTMTIAPAFVVPADVVKMTICTKTGKIATDSCRALGTTVTDLFVTGSAMTPTEVCPGHTITPTPVAPPVVP